MIAKTDQMKWDFTNEYGDCWKAYLTNDSLIVTGNDIDWEAVHIFKDQFQGTIDRIALALTSVGLIVMNIYIIDKSEAEWILSILKEITGVK